MNVSSTMKNPTKFVEKIAKLMGYCFDGIDPEDIKVESEYVVMFSIPACRNPLGATLLSIDNINGHYGVRMYTLCPVTKKYEKVYDRFDISLDDCASFAVKAYGYID